MKYHVVYDQTGRILSMAAVEQPMLKGSDTKPQAGPRAEPGQIVAEVDLPDSFSLNELVVHGEQIRVVPHGNGVRLVMSGQGDVR